MKTSDSLKTLLPKLLKIQAALPRLEKNKEAKAGTFSYRYTDLKTVCDALKDECFKNDICVIQSPVSSDRGVGVETAIYHKDGEFISSEFYLPLGKVDPQGAGAAITYARRYALVSLFFMEQEDDDAASAMPRETRANTEAPSFSDTTTWPPTECECGSTEFWLDYKGEPTVYRSGPNEGKQYAKCKKCKAFITRNDDEPF